MGPDLSDYAGMVVTTDNKDIGNKQEWWQPTQLSDDQTGNLSLGLIIPLAVGTAFVLFRTFGVGWVIVPIIVFLLVSNIGRWYRCHSLLDERKILERRLTSIRDSV